jgi:type I restriction enzyme R subunit
VQAHHHFSDFEWDGEPTDLTDIETDPPKTRSPERAERKVSDGKEPPPEKIVVRLADGKARRIQSMVETTFWDPSGTPMSARQFLESLFGTLPEFFKSEEDLRAIWSLPDTRKALLAGLADKGFGADALSEMQRVIDAENSDIFDVLAYVAFALDPLTRARRADDARAEVRRRYADRQQEFIDFVLDHYTKEGVGELDGDKLPTLLKLRYRGAIADAQVDLGTPEQIRGLFIGFQRYLYGASAGQAPVAS